MLADPDEEPVPVVRVRELPVPGSAEEQGVGAAVHLLNFQRNDRSLQAHFLLDRSLAAP